MSCIASDLCVVLFVYQYTDKQHSTQLTTSVEYAEIVGQAKSLPISERIGCCSFAHLYRASLCASFSLVPEKIHMHTLAIILGLPWQPSCSTSSMVNLAK